VSTAAGRALLDWWSHVVAPRYLDGAKWNVEIVSAILAIEAEAAAQADSLDAWFARVEAALLSDDGFDLSRTHYPEGPERYFAETWLENGKAIGRHGPTPVAALQALHAALTKEKGK
jgi:hypothetical protein